MATAKKPSSASDDLRGALKKKFKGSSISSLAKKTRSALTETIPTGMDVLDKWVLGCGGLPIGRIIEMYAEESAGKTSLGLAWLAAAQRAGGMGILYETERTLQPERATIFGADLDDVIYGEPATIDELLVQLNFLLDKIPKGVGPNVIVWDSLAASASANEIKGKPQPGDHARQMSSQLRVINGKLAEKRTCLVIINQVRMKIGVLWGNPETTPGGQTLKYLSSIRLAMWKGGGVKEGPDVVGHRVTIKAMKNKVAFPMRKVSIRLDYRFGFDDEWSTIDFAKERELIPDGAKMTPATYERALEELGKMPGWYPNAFNPLKGDADADTGTEDDTGSSDAEHEGERGDPGGEAESDGDGGSSSGDTGGSEGDSGRDESDGEDRAPSKKRGGAKKRAGSKKKATRKKPESE